MATKTQYAAVLRAIKSAPNSIGVEMIATRSGLAEHLVRTIVSALCETRHIKENAERASTYFTRRPMRAEIDAFLEAQGVGLTGITFEAEAAPVTTSSHMDYANAPAMSVQKLLGRILENPTSHIVTAPEMVEKVNQLIELGLVRRHRDYPTKYFTNPAKRDDIRKYIAGQISWAQLIGENADHNPGPVAPVITSAPAREGVWACFGTSFAGKREYRVDTMDGGRRTPAREDDYYYGNFEDTYKRILSTVLGAPHSIGFDTDYNAVMRLIKLGFLRIHRDDNSKFFTEPSKRADIRRYLDGNITLDQLFGFMPMPAPARTETSTQSLLRAIRTATGSVPVGECQALNELLDLGLVREHRDKPGFYFTEPSERELIDDYLAGEISWDEVEDFAGQSDLAGELMAACPCEPAPSAVNPDVVALAEAVKALAEVIIRANS